MSASRTFLTWQLRQGLGADLPWDLRISLVVAPAVATVILVALLQRLPDPDKDTLAQSALGCVAAFFPVGMAASSRHRLVPDAILRSGVTHGSALLSRAAAITVRTAVIVAPATLLLAPQRAVMAPLLLLTAWAGAGLGTAVKARFSQGLPASTPWLFAVYGVVAAVALALDALLRGPYSLPHRLGRLLVVLREPRGPGPGIVDWFAEEPDAPAGTVSVAIPWLLAALAGSIIALALTISDLHRSRRSP